MKSTGVVSYRGRCLYNQRNYVPEIVGPVHWMLCIDISTGTTPSFWFFSGAHHAPNAWFQITAWRPHSFARLLIVLQARSPNVGRYRWWCHRGICARDQLHHFYCCAAAIVSDIQARHTSQWFHCSSQLQILKAKTTNNDDTVATAAMRHNCNYDRGATCFPTIWAKERNILKDRNFTPRRLHIFCVVWLWPLYTLVVVAVLDTLSSGAWQNQYGGTCCCCFNSIQFNSIQFNSIQTHKAHYQHLMISALGA